MDHAKKLGKEVFHLKTERQAMVGFAGLQLNDIITATNLNQQKIQAIPEHVSTMKEISKTVHKSMKMLEELNQNNSKAVEEITLSTKEMSQQVIQDSQAAQHLTDIAQSQNNVLVQYFDQEE